MKTFREVREGLNEGKLTKLSTISTAAIVLKIKALDSKIRTTTDTIEQNKLLSLQIKYLSYIVGLGLAISASDSNLLSRMNRLLPNRK
jgi:hypothetical protein